MDMYEIIKMKRDGEKLTKNQIDFFVDASVKHKIPSYQISALLMAIFLNGMDEEETENLTVAMKNSGTVLDLSGIKGIKIDKHSTGGVGDKTTLIAAPIAAAAGVPVAKMSGRGLGFTGGTIDKLESIPGYRTNLSVEEFTKNVNDIGISIIGQTEHVAAADKIFYSLRDVTATVDNISLIASSILSKKLALGCDGILFDIKCGEGAFMKTQEDAERLGKLMEGIATAAGKKAMFVISDMNRPLGRNIGNSIEVIESIETLKGHGPSDITSLSTTLAGIMIFMGEKADSYEEGIKIAKKKLADGSALAKFRELIERQGGNANVCCNYELLPAAKYETEFRSNERGYIKEIKGDILGRAAMHTGAGRRVAEDSISHGAGISLMKKIGDFVEKGDILCKIYTEDESCISDVEQELKNGYIFSGNAVEYPKLIKKII